MRILRVPLLQLLDVTKEYGSSKDRASDRRGVAARRGVSIEVDAGDTVAVMGPSGCGKSTLLHLIGAMDRPTSGDVRLDGRSIGDLSDTELAQLRRRDLGFVFQFFNLLPTLTVMENLLLPLELTGSDLGKERALHLLAAVGLAERADSFPDRLSGGEQQRVAIARALVHEPGLLLADEPTGNLDEETGARVVQLLEDLVDEAGATLLVVTHSRGLASRMDRVLRVEHGLLIETATSDTVKSDS